MINSKYAEIEKQLMSNMESIDSPKIKMDLRSPQKAEAEVEESPMTKATM